MFRNKFITLSSILFASVALCSMTLLREVEYLIIGTLCIIYFVVFTLGMVNKSLHAIMFSEEYPRGRKQLIPSMVVSAIMGTSAMVAHFTVTVPGPPPTIPNFESGDNI
ncbi:MAG: hypothetical protein L3J39_17080 [Verrucomicrobiales bacterium]|nr:hypothetical protein [Verrucomicrobiales bacterium]